MYIVAMAWLYVALMAAVAEATGSQGSLLGASLTFVFYGLLPMAIVIYIMGTPARRRARRAREASGPPDRGGHAAGDPVTAERKEP